MNRYPHKTVIRQSTTPAGLKMNATEWEIAQIGDIRVLKGADDKPFNPLTTTDAVYDRPNTQDFRRGVKQLLRKK